MQARKELRDDRSKHNVKAVRIHEYGGPNVLVYEDSPRPTPAPGEVLVRVHAAGVNPVDWKTRQGSGMAGRLGGFPIILGWDVSGEIEAVGQGVEDVAVGDAVYGMVRFPQEGRAYAEYVAAPASHLAPKPHTLSHIEAAALPLAALTAWQALFDVAQLAPAQTVLIHAAAGGVGHLAVQLAKWRGASVIGTASTQNLEFVRSLGADQVVDYTSTPFEDVVRNVDVVLDTVGGETADRSFGVLKPNGLLVTITGLAPHMLDTAAQHGVRAAGMLVAPNAAQLREMMWLVDDSRLRPSVGETLPLHEAARAHMLSESRHARGKIVLHVR